MTRYDPFSYGSVRLEPGAPGAPEDPKAHDAEDLLFAQGESVKQAPPADDSWSLMDEDVGDLLPGNGSPFADATDFGAEILGEASETEIPAIAQVPEPRRLEVGTRPPVEEAASAEQAPRSATANRREVRRRELPSVRPVPVAKGAEAASRPAVPRRRRSAMLAVVAPLLLFAGGGSGAAWFWTMQHNPVMAGILGATTLVGALFAWLLLRP